MAELETLAYSIWPVTVQRLICLVNCIWFVPMINLFIRGFLFLRCASLSEVRRRYLEIEQQGAPGPIILCSNHLTAIDSLMLGCFLNPPYKYLFNSRALPWSVPEAANFKQNFLVHALSYLGKSIFVERLGSKASKQETLGKISQVLAQGDIVSIFPEGGRSRTGMVNIENCVYGVGDLLQEFPQCRVICIYLRGRRQDTYSVFPKFADTIEFSLGEIKPKTEFNGRRGSRDLTLQIMRQLKAMEYGMLSGR